MAYEAEKEIGKIGPAPEAGAEKSQAFDGGKLLSENKAATATVEKFNAPQHADLHNQMEKNWDGYLKEQTARETQEREKGHYDSRRENPSPDNPRGVFDEHKFVERRKEQDEKALAKLNDGDLKTIGQIADSLMKNDVEKAHEIIKQSYDRSKYDDDKINSVDLGLRYELERRGTDKCWDVSFAHGPEDSYVHIYDKRTNLATGGGTEYQSYEGKIGK